MKRQILFLLVLVMVCESWSIPKPMESITNYNVMMVHGAYGIKNSDGELQGFEPGSYSQAIDAKDRLGAATMGSYTSNNRVTKWISHDILEEPEWGNDSSYVRNSYVYNWRAFSNTRNTSKNNAVELGDRTWNKEGKFGQRRALVEEAQEVKAVFFNSSTGRNDSGQVALDSIRRNPDLYRQLASRYILIGHSMGGVVSREYVQNSNYYHGDVDKIITLDSPHEGTGALNMQMAMQVLDCSHDGEPCYFNESNAATLIGEGMGNWVPMTAALATAAAILSKDWTTSTIALYGFVSSFGLGALNYLVGGAVELFLEDYRPDDPLVNYVDPNYTGENINVLKTKKNIPDSLPMFRLLAMDHSMTFTDPDKGARSALSIMIPDALTVPFANFMYQADSEDSFSENYSNAMTGLFLGFVGGINVQGKGSSLVETDIGLAKHTTMLTHPEVDVERNIQNAAYYSSPDAYEIALIATMAAIAGIEVANFIYYYPLQVALKVGIPASAAIAIISTLPAALTTGFRDLMKSHNLPIDKVFKDWMLNDSVHVYEDFLYEKPFVNLLLGDAHTLEMIDNDTTNGKTATAKLSKSCFYIGSRDSAECVVGFFGDSVQNTSVSENVSVSKLEPLKFHSSQDWNEFGVKVDRWEKVPGLTSSGAQNDTLVPIRHVERYKLPKIVATDYIHRYSFVVDDLMPHRLREITMNFNFQTEIKWVCNIKIDPKLDTACTVYADKNDGNGLQPIGKVPHPVEKNGDFIFVPANLPDSAFKNLAYFQKDNQNTVTISTVNKIGLSNTQRFFYLAKMTEDLYEAKWPLPNIVVTGVDNFKLTASTLDYQGFRIDSLSTDSIFVDTAFTKDSAVVANARFTDLRMGFSSDGKGATLTSAQKNSNVPEGHYIWKINISVANDTSAAVVPYSVPFSVDRTPPQVSLSRESGRLNPNRTNILARVVNVDSMLDIRAMRVYLSKWNGNRFEFHAKLPSLYDVSNPNFAIFRDSSIRLDDGKYRLNIFAIDRALPDYDAYEKVAGLVNKIVAGNDTESDWNSIESLALNKTRDFVEFYVDTTPPVFTFSNVRAERSNSEPSPFTLPQKVDTLLYIGADDRLKMSYNVKENNIDSASVVKLYYSFMHWPDTSAADRMGDSVTIISANGYNGDWLENDHMLISDGDYRIKVTAVDGADNESEKKYDKVVRVDRISPNIETLVSTKLVYPKDETSFGAKLVVNESMMPLKTALGSVAIVV